MITFRLLQQSRLVLCALALGIVTSACAQQPAKEFEPQVGQQGKDVIWVPTPQALVDKMLDMAKVTPNDYVIDLGSGDGRTVITAAKRGARALGIEYNPDMVALSQRNAAAAGIGEKARFVQGDLFESDFSQATVITLFLLPDINVKLRPRILDMKPGTRVVSNSFSMGDWQADEEASVEDTAGSYWRNALLWIVPAKVEGTWRMPQGELQLKQTYQTVTGSVRTGNRLSPIEGGKLRGDQITFKAGNAQYSGRVAGGSMEGKVQSGGNTTGWSANRVDAGR